MKTVRIVDLFCGAGGTSAGAVEAIAAVGGKPELTAINHWPVAVATHAVNHPGARHLCTSVDDVAPKSLFNEGQLDVMWASPECTHHSIARGGRPVNDQSRATAWCVIRWAQELMPPVILVENVPEFLSWGGIGANGRPMESKKGETFRAWVAALRSLGYRVEWRILCAADYGDPTTRERLFVMAVRGKRRVIWPEPTHFKDATPDLFGKRRPWVPAREVIDWTIPSTSIYERKRPLSEKTVRRIMEGLKKFGVGPFIAAWDHQSGSGVWPASKPLSTVTTKARHGIVEPYLVELRGTAPEQLDASARPLSAPISTISTSGAHHGLVEPFLVQVAHGESSGSRSRSLNQPLPTVCGTRGDVALIEPHILGQHSCSALRPISEPIPTVATAGAIALIEPFLISYCGTGTAKSTALPMDTVTTKDRFALVRPEVEVSGRRYVLDIKFRMLQPHELAAAQGFRKDYQFTGTKTDQVKQIGNAVPRRLARALLAAVLSQSSDVSWLADSESQIAA